MISPLELFRSFTKAEKYLLLGIAEYVEIKTDVFLMQEKDVPNDQIYLVLYGCLDIQITLANTQETKFVGVAKEGDVVGEMIMFGVATRTANVKARFETALLSWRKGDLLELLESVPSLGYKFLKIVGKQMAGKIRETNIELAQVSQMVLKQYEK